jgi:hypothetical protein
MNLTTIDQPPTKLNLADGKPWARGNNQGTPLIPNVDPQNQMAQMMMGIPMMMAALMQQQQQNHPVAPTFEQRHAQKTSLTIIPSSDDAPNLKSTNYPLLSDWLKGVDAQTNFKQAPSMHQTQLEKSWPMFHLPKPTKLRPTTQHWRTSSLMVNLSSPPGDQSQPAFLMMVRDLTLMVLLMIFTQNRKLEARQQRRTPLMLPHLSGPKRIFL